MHKLNENENQLYREYVLQLQVSDQNTLNKLGLGLCVFNLKINAMLLCTRKT